MAPRKPPVKRSAPTRRVRFSDTSPEFRQMFTDYMAASMPEFVSQFNASVLQSIGGTTPRGVETGTGAGSSGLGGPAVVRGSDSGGADAVVMQTVVGDDTHRGCTHKAFMGCKPPEFSGTEGAIGTLQWLEKLESIFEVVGCAQMDRVKFGTFMFEGSALTWWNTIVRTRGRDEISRLTWEQLRVLMTEEYVPESEIQRLEQELWNLTMQGLDIVGYTNRFYELSQLVPHLVHPENKRVSRYIYGLPQQIRGHVISSRPSTLRSAVEVASMLTHSLTRDGLGSEVKARQNSEDQQVKRSRRGNSRKKSHRTTRSLQIQSYVAVVPGAQEKHPKCDRCGVQHSRQKACWVCTRCKELGHTDRYCKIPPKGCFECGVVGHRKDRCPRLLSSGTGSGFASGSGS